MPITDLEQYKNWQPTSIDTASDGAITIAYNYGDMETTGFASRGNATLTTSMEEIGSLGQTSWANIQGKAVMAGVDKGVFAALIAIAAGVVVADTLSNQAASQLPPVAKFTASASSGNSPLSVTFDASSSTNAKAYAWDFGDGDTASTPKVTYIYQTPGTYTVTLTVTAANGLTAQATVTITVTQPAIPAIVAGGTSSPTAFSWPQASGSALDSSIWSTSVVASDDSATVQSGKMQLATGSSGSYTDHGVSVRTVQAWQSLDMTATIDVPSSDTSGLSIAMVDDSGTPYASVGVRQGTGMYKAHCGNMSVDRTQPNARPQVKAPPWGIRIRYEQQGALANFYVKIWDASNPQDVIWDSIIWQAIPVAVGTPLHLGFGIQNGGNVATISNMSIATATPLPAPVGYSDAANIYAWQLGIPNEGNNQIGLILPQSMAALPANAVLHLDDKKVYIWEQPGVIGGAVTGQVLNGGTAVIIRRPGGGRGAYCVVSQSNFTLLNFALTGSRYDPNTGITNWLYNNADELESGIVIHGGLGQKLINCTVKGVGGDGLQLARFNSVSVSNLTVDGAGRQGFSYNYGDGFDLNGFDVQHCGRSGSDGEPYSSTDYVNNISIENGKFAHYYNYALAGLGSGTKRNVVFKNINATGGLGLGDIAADGITCDEITYNWYDTEVSLGSNLRGWLLYSSGAINVTNCNVTLKVGPQTTINGVQVMVPIRGTSGTVGGNVFNNHNGGIVGVSQAVTIGSNSGNMTVEHV